MYDALLLLRVVVQLMRQLEKVVRPNVVHFSVVNPVTAVGVLRYVTLRYVVFVMITRRQWTDNDDNDDV